MKYLERWGRDTARERYGSPNEGSMKAPEGQELPQDPVDKQAANYSNEVPVKSWLRGGGEDATKMPNFDHSPPSSKMRR